MMTYLILGTCAIYITFGGFSMLSQVKELDHV